MLWDNLIFFEKNWFGRWLKDIGNFMYSSDVKMNLKQLYNAQEVTS